MGPTLRPQSMSMIDFEKEWQQNAQSQKIEGPIFLSANELAQEYHRVFDTPCLKDVMGEYNAHLDATDPAKSQTCGGKNYFHPFLLNISAILRPFLFTLY